ncbi:KptA family-domain-containing protein [Irpex rosettiformis]|uniref:KptA family-domain-containing protein n=1 Tax=Irpex rosettiformis TaxID=378272 RepID=A0ACB8TUR5_9APHY|nr:KptA family-domain-containing protein [Irpex rosettiformis]
MSEIRPQASQQQSLNKSQAKAQGKDQQQKLKGGARPRGLPSDSPELRLSKTVTWVLRHGAASEGLTMRTDGYVRVDDLLKIPKLQGLDFAALEKIVQDDKKGRFNLVQESETAKDGNISPIWWIRANQGHSIKTIEVEVTPVKSRADIPSGSAVHGTSRKAWETISTDVPPAQQGLSKMKRNHIHLAQGLPGTGVLSGMRRSSSIFIYIDLENALRAGLKFYLSANGVVLSEGDSHGFIPPQFFQRVEDSKGNALPDWQPTPAGEIVRGKVDSLPSSGDKVAELGDRAEDLSL